MHRISAALDLQLPPRDETLGVIFIGCMNEVMIHHFTDANYPVVCTDYFSDMTSFNAATAVAGLPAPLAAGNGEVCTISGLTASTTYHLAVVVYDAINQPSGLSNVVTATTKAPPKVGDANGDGYVNVGDLQALVAAWGSNDQGGWWNWDPNTDFNNDGYINVGDLQLLVANWNS